MGESIVFECTVNYLFLTTLKQFRDFNVIWHKWPKSVEISLHTDYNANTPICGEIYYHSMVYLLEKSGVLFTAMSEWELRAGHCPRRGPAPPGVCDEYGGAPFLGCEHVCS